jgi:hypothetical protein
MARNKQTRQDTHLLLGRQTHQRHGHAREEIEHNLKVHRAVVGPHCVSPQRSRGQSVQGPRRHSEAALVRSVGVKQAEHCERALVDAHKGRQVARVLEGEPRDAQRLLPQRAFLKQQRHNRSMRETNLGAVVDALHHSPVRRDQPVGQLVHRSTVCAALCQKTRNAKGVFCDDSSARLSCA